MGLKIGIPRALLYYYYYPLWEKFFRSLDIEVVLSPPTSRRIFERGVTLATDETCLPVKVFFGHAESLRDQGVDYIFLPRVVSMEEQTYLCPKFLGFPEVLTAQISNLPTVLTADFNLRKNNDDLDKVLYSLGKQLGYAGREINAAIKKARDALKEFERLLQSGQEFETAIKGRGVENNRQRPKISIAVLGHSYLLYDGFSSLDIRARLTKMGVQVITPENVSSEVVEREQAKLPKKLFWSHSKRILGAGYSFIADKSVHGIIHLSCFGCGPDSMVGDMVERMCRRQQKPFMLLTLDEHTGEAGIVTRLEAYIDMLRRRVEFEDNLSAYG